MPNRFAISRTRLIPTSRATRAVAALSDFSNARLKVTVPKYSSL